MTPTLKQLKRRPALWAKHNETRGGEIFPRITMPNGGVDFIGAGGGWYHDSVISWHDFAIAEWEFVGWL